MAKQEERPYIGIIFKCCKVYSRIYLNAQKTAFVGWCPRCARQVRFKVSPEGTADRFFEMS
ncbi:MAG: hypothetical protein ABIJ61_09215 [bacterium]